MCVVLHSRLSHARLFSGFWFDRFHRVINHTLLELIMNKKAKDLAPTADAARPSVPKPHFPPTQSAARTKPTEPAEVLGRHKNDGQKDHKGAR